MTSSVLAAGALGFSGAGAALTRTAAAALGDDARGFSRDFGVGWSLVGRHDGASDWSIEL